MKPVELVHEGYVKNRRVQRLCQHLTRRLSGTTSVLDVGAGDGKLARAVMDNIPGCTIEAVDVLVRPDAAVKVHHFDGRSLPFPDKSFDAVMIVDVLHHADDAAALVREASRVARKMVVIKDHVRQGILAQQRLKFMDVVGNRRHGVALPCNYFDRAQWAKMFDEAKLKVSAETYDLGLYPWPFRMVFGGGLQVIFDLVPA
jgi:SAM-dependent methyltransferase